MKTNMTLWQVCYSANTRKQSAFSRAPLIFFLDMFEREEESEHQPTTIASAVTELTAEQELELEAQTVDEDRESKARLIEENE